MKLSAMLTFLTLLAVASASASESAIRTTECGKSECPEGEMVPKKFIEGDVLVKKYCTTCHTEGRVMESLKRLRKERDGDYAQSVRSIVVKKIRLTGGEISRQDGKKILEYLVTL